MSDPADRNAGPCDRVSVRYMVDDTESEVARLWNAGARFRNTILEGPGGKQVLLKDPSGNIVELFEPARCNSAR